MIRNSTKATLGGRHFRPTTIALLLLFVTVPAIPDPAEQNWTHTVRIGPYGLKSFECEAARIVQNAQADGVSGIEVDNDIPADTKALSIPPRS